MFKKIDYILNNEDGASMTEIVVWISVILIIIVFFFIFRDNIIDFFKRSFGRVDKKHSGQSYISGS